MKVKFIPLCQCTTFHFVFIFSFLISSTLKAQVLVNPGFESENKADDQKTGWVFAGGTQPLPLGEGFNGMGSALMIHSNDHQKKGFSQLAPMHVASLCRYELSFKVKTQNIEEGTAEGYIWINLLDADSTKIYETRLGKFEGTKEWETFSRTFFVSGNTSAIRVGGTLSGKGTIWFDDFNLQEIKYNPDTISLSAEAENYIKVIVDTIRANALYRRRLNFEEIYQIFRFYAHSAKNTEDTYPAIQKSLAYLMDHHSGFYTPEQLKKMFGDVDIKTMMDSDGYIQNDNLNIDSLRASIDFCSGKLIDNQIGYLSVIDFTHVYMDAVRMYADSLQQIIAQLDRNPLKGWVIDLRKNGGGAVPPMVTGIGSLLQENNKGYFVDAQHVADSEFYYRDGAYYNHGLDETNPVPGLTSEVNYQVKDHTLPIAVLLGWGTASAGEFVAAILAGEPNVKMFGKKTHGLTTTNDIFLLEDGALLNLTTSFLANRHQLVYERGIEPDVVIDAAEPDANEDAVLQAALEWIYDNQ